MIKIQQNLKNGRNRIEFDGKFLIEKFQSEAFITNQV